MTFNAAKSNLLVLQGSDKTSKCHDKLLSQGEMVQQVERLTYLGLHLRDKQAYVDHWQSKIGKIERALFSLNCIGCHPKGLDQMSISSIYR
jgi:hypothetical protein